MTTGHLLTCAATVAGLILAACSVPSESPRSLWTDVGGEIPYVAKDIPESNRNAFCDGLKQQGFKVFYYGIVDKNLAQWTCTLEQDSLELQVDVYGSENATAIQVIRASVTALDLGGTAEDGLSFIASCASATCAGSDSLIVKRWVLENYNKDGAATIIGSVHLTIWAATKEYRGLWIDGV